MTLLNKLTSIQRRDAALERVERGAGPEWIAEARAVVIRVADAKETFTSDDVWAAGLEKPPEPRALGAVMRGLYQDGFIEPTGNFKRTIQASRHHAPIAIWRRGGKPQRLIDLL